MKNQTNKRKTHKIFVMAVYERSFSNSAPPIHHSISSRSSLFRSPKPRSTVSSSLLAVSALSSVTSPTWDAQVCKLFDDTLKPFLGHKHGFQKNLQFWSAFAEGSDTTHNGVQFKLKEIIPLIHEDCRVEFNPDLTTRGIPPEISSKIVILLSVRYHLSVFISKVREDSMIMRKRQSSSKNLLKALERHLSRLKDSVDSIIGKVDLEFDKRMRNEKPEDAVNRIYRNVYKMDMYLSYLVAMYRRPNEMLQNWMPYAAGAIVVATLSICIFSHSGPLGIMDNTVAAINKFVIDHVKEPLTDLKDELSSKSMKEDTVRIGIEEVRVADEALRRMSLDFIEPTTDHKSYTNKSNKEILELQYKRYAELTKGPFRGILTGDLVRAYFIQFHMLKVDYLTKKLAVNNIMRANGLTFAFISALPMIGVLSLGVSVIYKLLNKSELNGRLARRRLLQQIEWRLNELQRTDGHKEYLHGLLLYALDQLYKATEAPAKVTHEWESVRDEICNLGDIKLGGDEAYAILSRLKTNYACLL